MDENPYKSPRPIVEQPLSAWRKMASWPLLTFGVIFTLSATAVFGLQLRLAFLRADNPDNEILRFKPQHLITGLTSLAVGLPMLWGGLRLRRKKS